MKLDLSLDYHAHILPGCDHGSDGLATSLKQVEMAASAGVKTICATPHFYPHKESVESFLRRRKKTAGLLLRELPENAPLIQLGAEVLICDGMERMDGLNRLCREGTNELLLEMPFYAWPESIWDTLYLLCDLADIQIVLAHAERYPAENIEKLICESVPLQLNAECLTKPLKRKRYAEAEAVRRNLLMNVLITGANGFVGKNLTQRLSAIKDHRDRTRPALQIEEILLCTRDTSAETLVGYCQKADFVVHLAGVNRPQDPGEFAAGNTDFTRTLLEMLRESGNRCPVLLSSSIQASLTGRYAESPYGQSKKAAEELLLAYGRETGANGMIYRLPNLFGKWCRPNYNSVVATFCHHIARDLPITVSDPAVELELVYIDDLIDEILNAMEGHPNRTDGAYCSVPVSHPVTLGEIVRLLRTFREQPQTLLLPEIPDGSFAKKLYSTYLSYLPPEKIAFPLKMNVDERGSFTELLKTASCGQVSVNIIRPSVTKGQHWHNSKWEFFIVVAGHGLIQERRIGSDEKIEFEVSGDRIQAVHMLPGYTHNIINLSETENLVTVMWANEQFDPDHPDTYFEEV